MPLDLSDQTAFELKELFREGRASPSEAANTCLGRIRALNHTVNAFCMVDEADTLAHAG